MPRGFPKGDPRVLEAARKGGLAGAKTKRIRAIRRASERAGVPLTAEQTRLYRLAYENGRRAGDKSGYDRGYREGFRRAIGEVA